MGFTQSVGLFGVFVAGRQGLEGFLFSLSMVLGLIGMIAAFFTHTKNVVMWTYKAWIGGFLIAGVIGYSYLAWRIFLKSAEGVDSVALGVQMWAGSSMAITAIAVFLEKRRILPWAVADTQAGQKEKTGEPTISHSATDLTHSNRAIADKRLVHL